MMLGYAYGFTVDSDKRRWNSTQWIFNGYSMDIGSDGKILLKEFPVSMGCATSRAVFHQ